MKFTIDPNRLAHYEAQARACQGAINRAYQSYDAARKTVDKLESDIRSSTTGRVNAETRRKLAEAEADFAKEDERRLAACEAAANVQTVADRVKQHAVRAAGIPGYALR